MAKLGRWLNEYQVVKPDRRKKRASWLTQALAPV